MSSYQVINPCITGKFNTSYSGKTPLEAATNFWDSLSNHITNNVPKFAFTMEGGDGRLHHFIVEERVSKKNTHDGKINISELSLGLTADKISAFKNMCNKAKNNKFGGAHKKRYKDDDSSDSDDEINEEDHELDKKLNLLKFRNVSQPIPYVWYFPAVYEINKIYIPTFKIPLTPYVEIEVSSAIMG